MRRNVLDSSFYVFDIVTRNNLVVHMYERDNKTMQGQVKTNVYLMPLSQHNITGPNFLQWVPSIYIFNKCRDKIKFYLIFYY